MRTFENAYDAWWFLYEHPEFVYPERIERGPEITDLPVDSWKLCKDRNGNWYYESVFPMGNALDMNLDIHYAKVDSTGHVNDDQSLNTNIECWLEFGAIKWGYHTDWEDGREYKMNYHYIDLDCGGPTFDAAIVELAKLVLEHYGDYTPKWEKK